MQSKHFAGPFFFFFLLDMHIVIFDSPVDKLLYS